MEEKLATVTLKIHRLSLNIEKNENELKKVERVLNNVETGKWARMDVSMTGSEDMYVIPVDTSPTVIHSFRAFLLAYKEFIQEQIKTKSEELNSYLR